MRREKLYKNCVNKFLLTGFDSCPKLYMNNLRGKVVSPYDNNVWKTFLFCIYLDLHNNKTMIFLDQWAVAVESST